MALPAPPLPARSIPGGTPPVLDIDAMMRRLPAQARADLVWTRTPIAEASSRLRAEPLTEELLETVAVSFVTPMCAIASAVWRALAENPDEWRAALMSDFSNEEASLQAFLGEEDSRDTLTWITGFLRFFYATAFSSLPMDRIASVLEEEFEEAARQPEAIGFLIGMATLMAAAEEARAGGDVERARELVDCSFLQFREFRDRLRQEGLNLSAFPFETTEQRRDRFRKAVRHLRIALSQEDWRAIADARISTLR